VRARASPPRSRAPHRWAVRDQARPGRQDSRSRWSNISGSRPRATAPDALDVVHPVSWTTDGFASQRRRAASRGVVVGRRSWTFARSDAGGRRAATEFSLIGTCKLIDVASRACGAIGSRRGLPGRGGHRGPRRPRRANRRRRQDTPRLPCPRTGLRAAERRSSPRSVGG